MGYDLNDEKATDILIWWVEGSNGSIDFREKEAVKKVLSDINYSLQNYYEETIMHIGGLGTDKLKQLVQEAKEHGRKHFSDHRKRQTIALLYAVAESNDNVTDGQKDKLKELESAFGVEDMELWEEK